MTFYNSLKKLWSCLQKYRFTKGKAGILIFAGFLSWTNLTLIASEKDTLPKDRKPLKRTYTTMVDYVFFINKGQELPGPQALSNGLFITLRACSGMNLENENQPYKQLKPNQSKKIITKEAKPTYKQFIVLATMPLVVSLCSHIDPTSNLSDWNKLLTHINKHLDTYVTDDGSLVVFIPKSYKDDERFLLKKINIDKTIEIQEKCIEFSDKEEQLKYIGFNPQKLALFNINKIKPEDIHHTHDPNNENQIDVKKLQTIFALASTWVARCVFLNGHGSYKTSIAGMNKHTYLQFLNLLEKINTQFLYIASCYAGGINAVVMNHLLKDNFNNTLDIQKPFDIQNIHFPIVLNSASDTPSTGSILSLDDNKIFFLNNFFAMLEAFLASPTWDVGIKKAEWRIEHGKKLQPERYKNAHELSKLAALQELEALKLIESKEKINEEKGKKLMSESQSLKERAQKLIPMVAGPLIFMNDVLNIIYQITPRLENLPSIYIPDCTEFPEGLFFESVKVDNMKIITNKHLKSHSALQNLEPHIMIAHKTSQSTNHKKQIKYVLVYPVDISRSKLEISSKTFPKLISKIGGNAYHILGNLVTQASDLIELIKGFLYPIAVFTESFRIGVSHKAWLIKHVQLSDQTLQNVVFYKPAAPKKDINRELSFLIIYSSRNEFYIQKYTLRFNLLHNLCCIEPESI